MKNEVLDDDEVIKIPIYLNQSITDQMCLFQYPCRPDEDFNEENIINARFKPMAERMELEIGLNTDSSTYDKKKGEHISLMVDGASKEFRGNENYFESNKMDKIVLRSSKSINDASKYCVGLLRDGAIHLVPIKSIFSLKPSVDFIDKSKDLGKADAKENVADGEEDVVKKVTVRFERPETERSRMLKEKSYGFIQKKIREEPWYNMVYHGSNSERCQFEMNQNFRGETSDCSGFSTFTVDPSTYMNQLIPKSDDNVAKGESSQSITPHLSMSALRELQLPLHKRVSLIMERAGVVSFNELLCSVVTGVRDESDFVLKIIQQIAVLVQGNWVVKSDLLYPKENTKSTNSTVTNECLQRARDYLLYLFDSKPSVSRSEVTSALDVPENDLTSILRSVANPKHSRGLWQFSLPFDASFVKRYPDVHDRQKKIWQSRYKQLMLHFITK